MIIKCIKQVELELNTINDELKRIGNNPKDIHYFEDLQNEKQMLEKQKNKYKENLKKLPDLESRIYNKVVYEGINVTKAIRDIADENYMNDQKPTDPDYIFKKYWKKVKEII